MNQTAYDSKQSPNAATVPGAGAQPLTPLTDADLPLQRIYQSEQERGSCLLFTQPWKGAVHQWTWAQAIEESRRIASFLRAQSYPQGSHIAIMAKNCAWWILADFAIWMAGHVSIPIFPTVQVASLEAIFTQSRPVACFLGSVDHLPSIDHSCFQNIQWILLPTSAADTPAARPIGAVAWNEILHSHLPLAKNPVRPADEIASIIYTSGTTGQPKGVMHSFRAFSLMASAVKLTIGRTDGGEDIMLSYLPLAHIAERAIVEMSVFFGPLHVFFTAGQESFLADLERSQATVFFTIPRLLIRFQQGVLEKVPQKKLDLLLRIPILNGIVRRKILKQLGLGHVRIAASGAAPLPASVIDWYHRLKLNLVEGYGMTETGITHVPLPGRDRVGYVGEACPFALTRIAADGEIQIKGPMNFAGYYDNPEATCACFTEDGYFRTGDRGEIDELGRLRIVGRLKEEFKTSKGKYVIPSQIEKALSLCLHFESVCVLGSGMTAPFALAVLTPAARASCATPEGMAAMERSLEDEILATNAQHEHHERLAFLVIDPQSWTSENSLLTPTLKVRRSMIEGRYQSRFAAWEQEKKHVIWLVRG